MFSVQQPRSMSHFDFLTPLAYSKGCNKVLLKVNCQKFVWYDLEKKILSSVKIKDHHEDVCAVEICVGSLVPPSVGGGHGLHGLKLQKQEERKKRENKKGDDFLSTGFKLVFIITCRRMQNR